MKIMPITQSNQNQKSFKGTGQVLIKLGENNSEEVATFVQDVLKSYSPTAITKPVVNDKTLFYEIKASFPQKKDTIVLNKLLNLEKRFKENCYIAFHYTTDQHCLTPEELERFKLTPMWKKPAEQQHKQVE